MAWPPWSQGAYAIVAVALIWRTLGYMLQSARQQRMLALLAGLTIAFLATDVINATYLIGRAGLWKVNATYWVGQNDPSGQDPVVGMRYAINMIAGRAAWVRFSSYPRCQASCVG